MGNTEWTDEQRVWIKLRRKRHLRILAAALSLCVLFATYPNILETFFVFAAEREKEEKDLYISGFSDLPEEIKEQTVPLGTGLEELTLPDTLEAVVVQDGQGSAENSDEDADDREIGDVDEETDANPPSDKDEIGEDTGEPSDGEETDEETTGPSDGGESGGETTEPSGGEESGGETAEPSDGEESGGETAEPSDGKESEADNSGSKEENENVDQVEQDTQPEEAAAEETIIIESGDETGGEGDSALSGESEDTELKQETHTVTLPEYQAEHVITVERLENPSEKENKEDADDIEKSQVYDTDTVIITGVTWRSAPAYDKDTEGVYLFTAVLPEGYARMEGIGLPRITVTVAQTGTKPRRVAARVAEHTVTYNYSANGGTSAEKTSDTVSEGALIDLAPSASKKDWEFVGWNTSRSAKTGLETLTMGAADVTLYAIYKKTLYYDFYSGKTGDKETRTATIYNNEMKGRAYAPYLKEWSQTTDKGYTPKTWIMEGSGVSTGQGLYVDLNSDRNFYGRYEKEISISYDANGGEGTAGEQKGTVTATVKETETEIKGASVKLNNGTAFNLKGYLVDGWRDGPNGTEIVPAGSSVTLDKDTVFYAEWVPKTYQITYLLAGGTVTGNPESYTIESSNITLKNPARTGYTFTGWSGTDLSGSNNTDVTIQAGSTGDREYTAHWTVEDYKVTLNGNGGSGGTDLTTYTYGTGISLPTDWTRTGYSFEGWYDTEACDGEKVTEISAADVGDKEYWAKWTDDIAPVIGSLQYSYQAKNLWNWLIGNDSLTVTVPVTEEGSGADEITYTVTPTGAAGSKKTAAIANGKAQITVSADFKGTITIACTDKAGNTSAGVTVGAGLNAAGIIIEDNAPQIAFLVNNGAVSAEAYNSAPDITVTVTEDKDNAISGGIASVCYQIGNSGETEIQQNFTASMKTSAAFTIPAAQIPNGDTKITVKAVDHAGNMATATQTIRVKTEEEKVAAAKKVVQDTLAVITATNETTKEDIQNAIDTALSNAGIGDVTVTVGDLSKTDATSDAPGNISGGVSIVSKRDSTVRDDVTINKTIPATGESHTHDYKEWRHDAKDHWKVCSCGAAGAKSKHRYDNDRDTTCNDCGYKRKIKNPDKGDSDKDKPDHAGSETQNPTGNQQPSDTPQSPTAQQPINPPTVTPVKSPQPVAGTAGDPEKQPGAQTPKQLGRRPGQGAGQESKATAQQDGMDSAKITAGQQAEGGTAREDRVQQPEEKAAQTGTVQQTEDRTAQTVQAAVDGGRIAISGETVETGNLTENQKTATMFEVGKGTVTVRVVCDDGKCNAGVTDTVVLANTVLSPEQIQLVNYGENIEVRIDVKDISETVAGQDKEVIESGLAQCRETMPELTLGRYVDISVFVKIGEGDWETVTSTGEPIEVVMGIPKGLREDGREFYIIRSHEGEYTLLADMDDDPKTVTIRTDLFSAYALVYGQADRMEESGRCGLCHACPTFLGICCFIWLAVIASVVVAGIILLRRKKN
jgi:uncharacterized repeat protein (TIGR02543 family)